MEREREKKGVESWTDVPYCVEYVTVRPSILIFIMHKSGEWFIFTLIVYFPAYLMVSCLSEVSASLITSKRKCNSVHFKYNCISN